MASESESTLLWDCEVPKLDGMVHRARNEEITTIMEIAFPNWLTMLRVCGLALCINEIPYLDATVS